MSIYKSFDELNHKTLRNGDIVVFEINNDSSTSSITLRYKVLDKFFSLLNEPFFYFHNDKIFDSLGLNKVKLANEAYGYNVETTSRWPFFKTEDYEAATRLALVLFAFVEGSEHVEVKIPRKGWKKILRHPSYKVGDFFAHIHKNNVYVGCQEIPFEDVRRLYLAIKSSS